MRRLAAAGIGADAVSGAELGLALRCGVPAQAIVMSGVAKSDAEIDLALGHQIRALQVESVEELRRIEARARAANVRARVEHPFHVIKNLFRHRKVRYKGLAKNRAQLEVLFGLANLVLAKRALLA